MARSLRFTEHWPELALFDLDGTLVDSAPDLAAAVDTMLVQLGRQPAGLEQVRQWVGHGSDILVRRALAGRLDWEAAPCDDDLFRQAMDIFYRSYGEMNGRHARIFPGVTECLNRLQANGCRMAVVTNKPGRFVAPLLARVDLARYFGLTIAGDTLAVKKPDPAPLQHAMEKLGGTPANTVMLGDSAADANAARAAGIPCVLVRYGYNFGRPVDSLGADAVVDSLAELL